MTLYVPKIWMRNPQYTNQISWIYRSSYKKYLHFYLRCLALRTMDINKVIMDATPLMKALWHDTFLVVICAQRNEYFKK
jgi:hypothetical protein